MSSVWHRFLRGAAFIGGVALGVAATVFGYSNTAVVPIHWWGFSATSVSIGLVALVPLVAGVIAGYVYHLPARMHHFSEHMRHRSLVHELEKENKELRKSLDRLLELPDDSVEPRTLKGREPKALAEATRIEKPDLPEAMIAEAVIVHEVLHAAPRKSGGNGHRRPAKAPAEAKPQAATVSPAKPRPAASRGRAKLEPKPSPAHS